MKGNLSREEFKIICEEQAEYRNKYNEDYDIRQEWEENNDGQDIVGSSISIDRLSRESIRMILTRYIGEDGEQKEGRTDVLYFLKQTFWIPTIHQAEQLITICY